MKLTREYLQDLLDEIGLVEKFSREGEAVFLNDERTQYAVMMAHARIGEIVKRLPQSLLDSQPQAEWRQVKAFRDVLLHRYDSVNPRRVWEAVEKLAVLKAATESLLAAQPDDDDR